MSKKMNSRRKLLEDGEAKNDEDLVAIQKTIEIAAGKVGHHTKVEREHITQSTCELA